MLQACLACCLAVAMRAGHLLSLLQLLLLQTAMCMIAWGLSKRLDVSMAWGWQRRAQVRSSDKDRQQCSWCRMQSCQTDFGP